MACSVNKIYNALEIAQAEQMANTGGNPWLRIQQVLSIFSMHGYGKRACERNLIEMRDNNWIVIVVNSNGKQITCVRHTGGTLLPVAVSPLKDVYDDVSA